MCPHTESESPNFKHKEELCFAHKLHMKSEMGYSVSITVYALMLKPNLDKSEKHLSKTML